MTIPGEWAEPEARTPGRIEVGSHPRGGGQAAATLGRPDPAQFLLLSPIKGDLHYFTNLRSCIHRFEWHISGQKAGRLPNLVCFHASLLPEERGGCPRPQSTLPPLRSKRAHRDRL